MNNAFQSSQRSALGAVASSAPAPDMRPEVMVLLVRLENSVDDASKVFDALAGRIQKVTKPEAPTSAGAAVQADPDPHTEVGQILTDQCRRIECLVDNMNSILLRLAI